MKKDLRVLLLEDSETDAELVLRELRKGEIQYNPLVVQTKDDFEKALNEFEPHVILSDHMLPQFNSQDALKMVKERGKSCPFILVTGSVSEEFAVQSIKNGADDYILKDRIARLPTAIARALAKREMEREREQFLEKIVASESMLKEAEQAAQFGSWQIDVKSEQIRWSDEVYRIYGYEPGEIEPTMMTIMQHLHPEDAESFQHSMETIFEKQGSYEAELRFIDKNGIDKYVNYKVILELDDEGQLDRLFGFTQDITERKRAEIALHKSQQEYKALFDQNPDGVYSIAPDGKFLNVNQSLADLLETEIETLLNKDFLPFCHPDDVDEALDKFAKTLHGQPSQMDLRVITARGNHKIANVTSFPISIEDGSVRVYGVAKDVTQSREQLKAIEAQNKKLREIAWEQSHMVRAPLATMMGLIDLMDKLDEEEITREELLQHVMVSAKELDSIIRNIVKKTEQINMKGK